MSARVIATRSACRLHGTERLGNLHWRECWPSTAFGMGAVPLRPQFGERHAGRCSDAHLNFLTATTAIHDHADRARFDRAVLGDISLRAVAQRKGEFDLGGGHGFTSLLAAAALKSHITCSTNITIEHIMFEPVKDVTEKPHASG